MIHEPLTKLQCSPTSDGSAARDRRLRALRRRARPLGPGGRDRRPGDGHRHALDVRRDARLHQDRRLRHVEGGRAPGLRGGRASAPTTSTSRAPRLLQRQRADHLRGARPRRRGRGPQARRGRGHDLRRRRPGRQPLRRADLQGPPARRDRPRAVHASSPGSCAATPTSARSTARRSALQHNIGLGGAAVVSVYKPARQGVSA